MLTAIATIVIVVAAILYILDFFGLV